MMTRIKLKILSIHALKFPKKICNNGDNEEFKHMSNRRLPNCILKLRSKGTIPSACNYIKEAEK